MGLGLLRYLLGQRLLLAAAAVGWVHVRLLEAGAGLVRRQWARGEPLLLAGLLTAHTLPAPYQSLSAIPSPGLPLTFVDTSFISVCHARWPFLQAIQTCLSATIANAIAEVKLPGLVKGSNPLLSINMHACLTHEASVVALQSWQLRGCMAQEDRTFSWSHSVVGQGGSVKALPAHLHLLMQRSLLRARKPRQILPLHAHTECRRAVLPADPTPEFIKVQRWQPPNDKSVSALSEIRTRVNCVAGNYDTPTLTTLACQICIWRFELSTHSGKPLQFGAHKVVKLSKMEQACTHQRDVRLSHGQEPQERLRSCLQEQNGLKLEI